MITIAKLKSAGACYCIPDSPFVGDNLKVWELDYNAALENRARILAWIEAGPGGGRTLTEIFENASIPAHDRVWVFDYFVASRDWERYDEILSDCTLSSHEANMMYLNEQRLKFGDEL